jgi:tryptophanyl-tRNA synthetase
MEPIWEKRNELLKNPDVLHDIAKKGTEKARTVARETMHLVREAMGLF